MIHYHLRNIRLNNTHGHFSSDVNNVFRYAQRNTDLVVEECNSYSRGFCECDWKEQQKEKQQ